MNANVLFAVFKRNFVAYFSSPTGYLFICVFMWLSVWAAFWPNDFFNANLANLDQLNGYFPLIMLVFVPAITMSIWADERRQGTDELLLTIPAGDLDIVLGKYLAAVAIYSLSLVFSLACTFTVLQMLGDPDVGLFLGTYFGYWLVGLAMLAVGMVASFLTGNLTVAYILGAVFNAPMVFANTEALTVAVRALISVPAKLVAWANMVISADGLAVLRKQLEDAALNVPQRVAWQIEAWGIGGQFADFGRGVVSLAGIAYFLSIVAVMLYLSIVLIGRRHWRSGQVGGSAYIFYPLLHVISLLVFALAWFLLRDAMAPFTLLLLLVGAYLAVQVAVLLLWSVVGGKVSVLPGHYITRTLALGAACFGLVLLLRYHDLRLDVTSEQLNSLSRETVNLLRDIDVDRPVQIEAFISPETEVPETYVQTRLNLLNRLREMAAYGGEKIELRINETELFSDQADRAGQRYGIEPRQVQSVERGALKREPLFLGVAFTCGLEKVIVPFIDRGIPIEYELVRSIATVTQQKRKKLGVVDTDASLYGNFMSGSPNWPIIEELEKQYEVKRVDLQGPLDEEFDVLLAVQPSTLGPEQMDHLVAAIRAGTPAAIFEDPCPRFAPWVPATSQPRRPPNMNPMMMMGRPPEMPKGNLNQLWDTLGVEFFSDKIVWQDYNPYPKIDLFTQEKPFVFVGTGSGAREPFSDESEITRKLQNALFPFPGSIRELEASDLDHTELVRTGPRTGEVRYEELLTPNPFGAPRMNPNPRLRSTREEYVLAMKIRGKAQPDSSMADDAGPAGASGGEAAGGKPEEGKPDGAGDGDGKAKDAEKPKEDGEISVVVVADIDMLTPTFFALREQGEIEELGITFDFDNVTFVLNTLDDLAGDERFIDIRSRRPKHRTLTRIEQATEEAREETAEERENAYEAFEEAKKEEQAALDKKIEALRKRDDIPAQDKVIQVAMALQDGQRRLDATIDELEQDLESKMNRIETTLARKKRQIQDAYKMWAVVLPPIPPLLVALGVFLTRRAREREGVARSRLK